MTGTAAIPQLLTMDQFAERLGVTRRHVSPPGRREEGALFEGWKVYPLRPGGDLGLA